MSTTPSCRSWRAILSLGSLCLGSLVFLGCSDSATMRLIQPPAVVEPSTAFDNAGKSALPDDPRDLPQSITIADVVTMVGRSNRDDVALAFNQVAASMGAAATYATQQGESATTLVALQSAYSSLGSATSALGTALISNDSSTARTNSILIAQTMQNMATQYQTLGRTDVAGVLASTAQAAQAMAQALSAGLGDDDALLNFLEADANYRNGVADVAVALSNYTVAAGMVAPNSVATRTAESYQFYYDVQVKYNNTSFTPQTATSWVHAVGIASDPIAGLYYRQYTAQISSWSTSIKFIAESMQGAQWGNTGTLVLQTTPIVQTMTLTQWKVVKKGGTEPGSTLPASIQRALETERTIVRMQRSGVVGGTD